jgi:sensor histidine kinase YesM
MMKQDQRWQHVGFDDRKFILVGVVLLASITTYLFNSEFYSIQDFVISYAISLVFAASNWLLMRWVMIRLRRKYPSISDSVKRNLIFLLLIIAIVVGINALGNFLLGLAFGPNFNGGGVELKIIIVLISIMTMAAYEAIYFFQKLKASIVKEEQTRQAITQSQLDALRNQARPHFLFNSLNTLRDIIDTDAKSDAKDFVDHIADVYRFILDSGQDNVVSLDDEIAFAKSYLHIQSERFGSNLRVNWDIGDSHRSARVIPMSIQLLLENAIKHNIISKRKPLHIMISSHDDTITVSNNLQPKQSQLPSTKLGLENIKKRYALVGTTPPMVKQAEDHFTVTIPLINT